MPTHAELTGKLLEDAAVFFRRLGEQNDAIKKDMENNAAIFEQMGKLIVDQPEAEVNGQTHKDLAAKLLKEAATFFRALAAENEPLKEQMTENAKAYEQMSIRVAQDPMGIIE